MQNKEGTQKSKKQTRGANSGEANWWFGARWFGSGGTFHLPSTSLAGARSARNWLSHAGQEKYRGLCHVLCVKKIPSTTTRGSNPQTTNPSHQLRDTSQVLVLTWQKTHTTSWTLKLPIKKVASHPELRVAIATFLSWNFEGSG